MKKNKALEYLQHEFSEKKSAEQEALLKFGRQVLEKIQAQEGLLKNIKDRLVYLKLEWQDLLHDRLENLANRISVNDNAYQATALNYREFCEAFERTRKLNINDKRNPLYLSSTATQPWQFGTISTGPFTSQSLQLDFNNSTSDLNKNDFIWSASTTPEQRAVMEKSLAPLIAEKNVKVKAKRLTTKKLSR